MFYHERRDPAEAEFWRRLIDHGPGPLTRPVHTIEQVRAEFAEQHRRRERATELTKAGFWNLAQVILASPESCVGVLAALDAEPAPIGTDAPAEQVKPEGDRFDPDNKSAAIEGCVKRFPISPELGEARAEVPHRNLAPLLTAPLTGPVHAPDDALRDHKEAEQSVQRDDCCVKDTLPVWQSDQAESSFEISDLREVFRGLRGASPIAPSLIGKSETSDGSDPTFKPRPCRTPPSKPTKPKRKRPKRPRKKTISVDEREALEIAYFVATAKGWHLNMAADFNPGIDHMNVEERLRFCRKMEKNLLSYARGRCAVRGMPLSWWPCPFMWARESTRGTDRDEHLHMVFHVPDDEERRHLRKLMEQKRKDPNAKKWCENAMFRLVDNFEHWNGRKFESALGYLLKMAHPQTYRNDPTILYKKSGFIAGPRTRISKNLTNPEVVEETRIAVRALMRLRDENRTIMRRNGTKSARDPRSLVQALRTHGPGPVRLGAGRVDLALAGRRASTVPERADPEGREKEAPSIY